MNVENIQFEKKLLEQEIKELKQQLNQFEE